MAGQNTLIIANDYNVIQSKIALVMGTGSGTKGYGQTLASSQVGANSKVTVAQWNNLRSDIVRARQHQTGTTIGTKAPGDVGYVAGTDLPVPTAAVQVKENWRAAYLNMADAADTNHLTVPAPESNTSRLPLVSNQIRSAVWNTRVSQTVTAEWANADAARYFWNSGGEIWFSSEFSPRIAGDKNLTWYTMLLSMGTIKMRYNDVVTTGIGTVIGTGFYELGTSDSLIFVKEAPSSGFYSQNEYFITARVNDTVDRKKVIFTITWADDSTAPVSAPDPGFGVDENVDGTLTSYVEYVRASSTTNVSVPTVVGSTTPIAV
jgi:hypothetical protein